MSTSLPTRLKELRKKRGLSLSGLAAASSVSKAHLHAIESARTANPGAATLRKLAAALGVTPEYLFSGGGSEQSAEDEAMFEKYLRLSDVDRRKVRQIVDLFAGDMG